MSNLKWSHVCSEQERPIREKDLPYALHKKNDFICVKSLVLVEN